MTEQTRAIITEHQKALTNKQLLAQWLVLESRKKVLAEKVKQNNCALFRMKLANAFEWCESIRLELENRISRKTLAGALRLFTDNKVPLRLLQ